MEVYYITMSTHCVKISIRDGRIYCFKYSNDRYDMEVFNDEESAIDYIITAFPNLSWYVSMEE